MFRPVYRQGLFTYGCRQTGRTHLIFIRVQTGGHGMPFKLRGNSPPPQSPPLRFPHMILLGFCFNDFQRRTLSLFFRAAFGRKQPDPLRCFRSRHPDRQSLSHRTFHTIPGHQTETSLTSWLLETVKETAAGLCPRDICGGNKSAGCLLSFYRPFYALPLFSPKLRSSCQNCLLDRAQAQRWTTQASLAHK